MRSALLATAAAPVPIGSADDLALLDVTEACRFFGGNNSPIHPTTLYKGIKAGRYPAPIKQGPGTSRWVLGECRASLRKIIASQRAY
jgi:predicted DNA-binding transcriptional regulator AlpA